MSEELPLEKFVLPLRLAAITSYIAGAALLLFEPLRPLATLALLAAIVLHRFAGPLTLRPGPGIAVVGEGGVRDPRIKTWIRFDQIDQVRVRDDGRDCKSVVELLDPTGKLIASLDQPDCDDDLADKIEAAVARARAEREAHRHDPSSTVDWLANLERSLHSDGYRSAAVDLDEALRQLEDVHNPVEVRASAACALIASRDQRRLLQVRSRVNHNSPPLLIAVCDAVEPGLMDTYLVQDARLYLTAEERSAILLFVSRHTRGRPRFRVAYDDAALSVPDNDEAVGVTADQPTPQTRSEA